MQEKLRCSIVVGCLHFRIVADDQPNVPFRNTRPGFVPANKGKSRIDKKEKKENVNTKKGCRYKESVCAHNPLGSMIQKDNLFEGPEIPLCKLLHVYKKMENYKSISYRK